MTTTIWIFIAVLGLLLGYFLVQLSRDIIWNYKLNNYQKKFGATIKKEKSFFWFKRSYGALVTSAFMLTTIFSCVLVDNNYEGLNKKILVNAKSVNNYKTLSSLTNPKGGGWFVTDEDSSINKGDSPEAPHQDRDYIGTNVQVAGVDEGDLIKTDGNKLYYAPKYHNKVMVFNILDDGMADLETTIDLKDGYVDSIYLTDDYLIVIGYQYSYIPYFSDVVSDMIELEIIYGWKMPSYTGQISVYNKEDLTLSYSLTTDTNFYEHRLIKDTLFLVSRKNIYGRDLRPKFITKDANENQEVSYLSYRDIYYFDDKITHSMTVLTALKLTDFTINSQAFLGEVDQIYANESHLYTTSYEYGKETIRTRIVKYEFSLEDSNINYLGTGSVEGYLQNSYWMDEYENNLRVVTISFNPVVNRLFVLKEDDTYDKLEIIGSITENLGLPGESVKSVIFHENLAYIVTFLQTDPRYTIDLTDPTKPTITNEEYITGFSSYLYVWNKEDGGNEVVGLGYEADENGLIYGLKLSAIDDTKGIQTDYVIPYRIGNEYYWINTEATYNPKAIMVSPKHKIFAFPITVYDIDGYTSKYLIFSIDFTKENPDEIISEPIIIEYSPSNYYLPIERGVYISQSGSNPFEFIYVLSPSGLISYNLLEKEIAQTITFLVSSYGNDFDTLD